MMKYVIIIFLLFAKSLLAKSVYHIEAGELVKISIPSSSNVHISTKKYLMIDDLYTHLKIVGKREGKTVINIGQNIHIIYVVPTAVKEAVKIADIKLKNMMGPEVQFTNGRLTVRGNIYRLKDWVDIREILANTNYNLQAIVDKDIENKLLKYIKKDIGKLPTPDSVKVKPKPKVTYYNTSKELQAVLKNYYKTWGIDDVEFIENPEVNYNLTIEIVLEFYEISKSVSKNYGINWLNNTTYQVLPEIKGPAGDLQAQLQLMLGQGEAKLVQKSTLKTANTHSVKFVAGGEIAIPQYSYKSKSTSWKTYGLQLNFTPKVVNNKIQTKIKTEVSDLHESQSINGIPGIKKNEYESLLMLNPNQPVIISGLIKNRQQKTSEGILGLSEIPIIGELFKSNQFVNNESELVVVMTAKIMDSL